MNKAELKSKAFSSVIWKFFERIFAQSISLIVSIILARILLPEDYGVVSIVSIFFSFANIFISGGLNTALIQKKNADDKDYSTILVTTLLLSAFIYIILFFLAPVISNVYAQPILTKIIRIMSLILPINAIKAVWCAYISSNLQFKKFFFATIIGTIVSAIVGIYMALHGFGAWSLVAQQMTNAIIDTLILCLSTRINIIFKIYFERFRSLFKYAWKVLLTSFIGITYTEITPLFIGIKYTNTDLSYYTKGRSFPDLISTTSTNTISAVLFPVLAKYQDNKESLLRYTRLFMRLTSYIAFPLMIGFLCVSDNFITVVLTDKWLPASMYIKIFCLANMFNMIHVGNCETIKAMGRSDIYLIMEIIKKSCYFLIIIIFLLFSKSPIVLACSFILCSLVATIVNSVPNKKLIGYKYIYQVYDLLPNLIMSIIMGLIVTLIGFLPLEKPVILILQIVCGFFSYLLISVIGKNQSFFYIYNLLKEIFSKKDSKL